jgi:hypothetical protein
MLLAAAWMLFALGIGHIVFGLVRFKVPIKEAMEEGFVGKFMGCDTRRLAFWFIAFGPLLAFGGHVALHAVNAADYGLVKIIGFYLLGVSFVGVLALPKSPMWAGLLLALFLIAGGYGWIT